MMLWGPRTRGSQSHFLLETISKHMAKKNMIRSGQCGLPTRDTEFSWPDGPHSEVAGWVEEEGSGCCSPPQQGFDTAGHNISIHKMTRQAARWKENCLNCRGWWHKVQLECVVSKPFLSDLGTGQVHPQQLC